MTRLSPVIALVLLVSVLVVPARADQGKGKGHSHDISLGPVVPPEKPAKSPPKPTKAVTGKAVDPALVGTHEVDPIDLKILVIAADGNEADFPAITAFLDQIGVPYDVLMAATKDLTPDMLYDLQAQDSTGRYLHGYYQGIILTTDSLVYYDAAAGNFPSAFTADEWQTLWTYESMFNIRQVTFNTTGFGPEQFGLNWPNWDDTTRRISWQQTKTSPILARLTNAGQSQFNYLKSSYNVPFSTTDAVLATAGADVTPLMTTVAANGYASGYVMVSTYKNPADGRENLAITADSNAGLRHSLLLSYGVINWVTKGLFLGARHVYMNYQPDDLCIDNNVWDVSARSDETGLTVRMKGSDVTAAVTWQNKVQSQANTSQFSLEWPFNGDGCKSGTYPNDTLTAAIKQNQSKFKWINHTWDHANLNYPPAPEDQWDPTNRYYADFAFVLNELQRNHNAAKQTGTDPYLALSKYAQDAMIQPDISGLYNPYFYEAAHAFGIRYVISDTSRKPPKYPHDWDNPSPNAGYYAIAKFTGATNPDGTPEVQLERSQTPLPAPALLVIPRRPTNLFYNLYTPEQWVSEYNCYYSKAATNVNPCAGGQFLYWDRDLTYSEILDKESDWLLSYMLKWDLDPVMFHQPNVVVYNGSAKNRKSLLSDLVDATLQKYNSMYNLPVKSPSQSDQGRLMEQRMAYNSSGTSAQMIPCGEPNATPSITVKTVNAARIPVTGVAHGTAKETYGGQNISYVDLPAGGSVTIPLACR